VLALATAVSEHLLPATRAYYEIWLDDERVGGDDEADRIYGEAYLPRKFKIGFAVPPLNDVDVFAQDLGFIAVIEDGAITGYNVSIGGGMGASHGDPETYPRLADVVGFITPDQVIAVAEAVVTTQRDWGNRTVRKRARLKYTIDDRGLDAFKAEVERRAGIAFAPARTFEFAHNGDRFGWTEAGDGRGHLTLRILSGRIWDRDGLRHQSGMRAIAQALLDTDGVQLRLTPNQNLVIANVPAAQRAPVDALVAEYGLDTHVAASPLKRAALACVSLPTCGLAMAEAERYLPEFVAKFETLLDRHGLLDQPIHLRLSGCPNGCSRPYLAEVALVGKAPGRYNLMLGADHRGQRLNALYRENVDEAAILEALDALLARYAAGRAQDEHFGDFLARVGVVRDRRISLEVAA
jgi:sulfite reductase (NADPH) hemoprotein beta-component